MAADGVTPYGHPEPSGSVRDLGLNPPVFVWVPESAEVVRVAGSQHGSRAPSLWVADRHRRRWL